MVFPSAPSYLDPPNWQQENHPQGDEINPQFPLPLPPLPSTTGIRPGSMADRARLANIPQPEASLKCPRCDSINTKFCYFNNYSLNQPRHFCKTCRRYWTRGGTLRNVPVGGGCRRNKRNKRASSKSPATGDNNPSAPAATSTSISTLTQDLGLGQVSALVPPLPLTFMAGNMHDHHLGVYSNIAGANIGLSYSSSRAVGGGGAVEQWRTVAPQLNQQYPFISGLESPVGQMISVKMEGDQGLNSRANLSSSVVGQDQYSWGGNVWNEFSGFTTSSSTDHQML